MTPDGRNNGGTRSLAASLLHNFPSVRHKTTSPSIVTAIGCHVCRFLLHNLPRLENRVNLRTVSGHYRKVCSTTCAGKSNTSSKCHFWRIYPFFGNRPRFSLVPVGHTMVCSPRILRGTLQPPMVSQVTILSIAHFDCTMVTSAGYSIGITCTSKMM
uniref:Uncharacterized protein n=1 Tax=uncultured marine group II/III euryarchaeote KM3_203_F09 TaxID=1456423 RepID=A0A075GUX3_9EURY|nr:hypothetical protein [uncultured marine group II/III euryarchaeote KM3_203_F09]